MPRLFLRLYKCGLLLFFFSFIQGGYVTIQRSLWVAVTIFGQRPVPVRATSNWHRRTPLIGKSNQGLYQRIDACCYTCHNRKSTTGLGLRNTKKINLI
ncbi:uncharacterized protein RJT20DRAFT_25171 [Scheffersomyces xylosifermentans]|uniref:uncharacterized protein n=1 Tax=Scheffersomyces xylosifermentans TaxID=1304137 RepID=UPI00315D9A0D